MPVINTVVACPVHDSFRVQSVSGMFDVPLETRSTRRFVLEVPSLDEDWQIGAIVGPSGSGKSTIAQAAFGNNLVNGFRWRTDQALVDGFSQRLSMREIVKTLSAVGLNSPPAWCKPFCVLSTGEKFRANLARSVCRGRDVVAFDEYSSVVDRITAKFASLALNKAIRRGDVKCRFVAITCHEDIVDWLQPDWVASMSTGQLDWRCLRQPRIELSISEASRKHWPQFAPHHYLDGALNPCARCFIGTIGGRPAAMVAVLNHFHRTRFRVSRLVTLPTYQGVGIGGAMLDGVAQILTAQGAELVTISGSHPAVLAHAGRSPDWQFSKLLKDGRKPSGMYKANWKSSLGRAVATFRWIGDAAEF